MRPSHTHPHPRTGPRWRLAREIPSAAGEAFVICKAGRPMVRVTALDDVSSAAPAARRLGLGQGQCEVPDDFMQMAAGVIADLLEGLRQGN